MKLWVKLAFKEIINNKGFSLFFILNLSLGLMGFIALDSFKQSLHDHIQGQSKSLLSADVNITAYQKLASKEIDLVEKQLGKVTAKTSQILFNSMIGSAQDSRLAEISVVNSGYPLYGQLILEGLGKIGPEQAAQILQKKPTALIQKELMADLKIKTGDEVKIGQMTFTVGPALIDAPGQSFWNARITHKVFIGWEWAKQTGLLEFGSHKRYNYLYKIPNDSDAAALAAKTNKIIKEKYGTNPNFRVQPHNRANPQMSRLMGYLGDYLGLAALVALFLAGLGTAYLFRAYLSQKTKEMALLRSLGATAADTITFQLIQIAILGTLAAILAGFFGWALLPLLKWLLAGITPLGFEPNLNPTSLLLALGLGLLGSLLFCLPSLTELFIIKPQELFSEERETTPVKPKSTLLWSLAPLLFFWVLAIWQSHSYKVGSLFLGGLVLAGLILGVMGLVLLKFLGTQKIKNLNLRLAFRNLNRGGLASLASFVAIGLGALLINLIPQLEFGLQQEISQPKRAKLPSFFLFDIQPEQVGDLGTFIISQGYNIKQVSPMIAAKLYSLKGKDLNQKNNNEDSLTREEQTTRVTRRRAANLSSRSTLYDSETLSGGQFFTSDFDPESGLLPEISLEEWYAKRLGLTVGDKMGFNIMGVPIEGQVTSLRKVKWNSFQPNFFVLFQPKSLEDAPATYLGTIADIPEDQKTNLQNSIRTEFPNIAMINVARMVNRILKLTAQVSLAISAMAVLAMFAGLVVVYSIARFNAQTRLKEVNLLKVIGAKHRDLKIISLVEFGLLGLLASLTGSFLSLGMAKVIAEIMFDRSFEPYWGPTLLTIVLVSLLSALLGFLGVRGTLAKKPQFLLQAV